VWLLSGDGGFVVNIGRFHAYAGTIHKEIADLHLWNGWLHMKSDVFLVYTRDILV